MSWFRLSVIFILLNLLDVGLTTYIKAVAGDGVYEINPLVDLAMSGMGWIGLLVYKSVMVLLILYSLPRVLGMASANRVLTGACIGFGILMGYMVVLGVYQGR